MKLIYPEKQGTPTADTENGNYPASNLANNVRRKPYKAEEGNNTATLRCPIAANANALALFKTNAVSAVCTITLDADEQAVDNAPAVDKGGGLVGIPLTGHSRSEGDVILFHGSTNYNGVYTLPSQAAGSADEIIITASYVAETFAGTETICQVVSTQTHTLVTATRTYIRIWQEYTTQTGPHTATFHATAPSGETFYAGVFKAGLAISLKTTAKPTEGRKEYSVIVELNNGGEHGTLLAIVRTFQFSTLLTRETQFYDLTDVYDVVGKVTPLAWLLAENVNDYQWSVLAKFQNEISGDHDHKVTPTSISLLEVV